MIVPRKVRGNASISQLVGNIVKNSYILFEFCDGARGSWSEITPPPKNRDAPPPRLKNHPELGKNGRFLGFLHGAPRVLGGDVISLCRIVAPSQKYNSM